jgi:hypothetical protein
MASLVGQINNIAGALGGSQTAAQAVRGAGADSANSAPDAPRSGRPDAAPRAAPSAPRGVEARTTAAVPAPSARDTPPVPAIYARPPVLRTAGSPAWARNALESVAAVEQELLAMQARLVAGGGSSDADRAAWQRTADAFCGSWPLLDARRRDALIAAMAAVQPRLGSAEQRTGLRGPLDEAQRSQSSEPEALWRGSGAAGILAALDRRSAFRKNDTYSPHHGYALDAIISCGFVKSWNFPRPEFFAGKNAKLLVMLFGGYLHVLVSGRMDERACCFKTYLANFDLLRRPIKIIRPHAKSSR